MAPPSVTPRSGSALYTVYMSTPTLSPPIRHYEGLFVLHTQAEFWTLNLKYVDGERDESRHYFLHFYILIITHGINMDNRDTVTLH